MSCLSLFIVVLKAAGFWVLPVTHTSELYTQGLRSWSIPVNFFGYSGNELSNASRLKGNIVCMVGACLDLLLSLKMVLNHVFKHHKL